jgi:hypothetical protein
MLRITAQYPQNLFRLHSVNFSLNVSRPTVFQWAGLIPESERYRGSDKLLTPAWKRDLGIVFSRRIVKLLNAAVYEMIVPESE